VTAPWLKQAIIGVASKHSFQHEGELGVLLTRIADSEADAATAFGRGVGVIASCRRAAFPLCPSPERETSVAADDGSALAASHPWSAPLQGVISHGPLRLQVECCLALERVGASLPALVLPQALESGRGSLALRPVLLRVLGERGRWLASRNPEWKFAAGGVGENSASGVQVWDTGVFEDRLRYFQSARTEDPAAARELLQAQLGELPARERLALVELLQENLGIDDEPLLQSLLKDRSRDVRQVAAVLLASLPRSAHAQRLREWLGALVTTKRGLLGGSWQCEAPAALDPDWASAAIDGKRPQHESLGERAWWLYQMVRQLPLPWWCEHTGMTPAALLAWARKGDWKEALLRGWRERVSSSDCDWVEAMLESNARQLGPDKTRLLAMLPAAMRERHWPRDLDALAKGNQLGEVIESCAPGLVLSREYSLSLAEGMKSFLAGDRVRNDYWLRGLLLDLLCVLHADSLASCAAPHRDGDETPAQAEFLTEFERILGVRQLIKSTHP
jgi:hypothetical protein